MPELTEEAGTHEVVGDTSAADSILAEDREDEGRLRPDGRRHSVVPRSHLGRGTGPLGPGGYPAGVGSGVWRAQPRGAHAHLAGDRRFFRRRLRPDRGS